jgi:radical SAM superfamily enzyme YgiQ (UPF0313 family)
MTDIVLASLNARWSHCAFGLRCLRAALGPLRERSIIIEGTNADRPVDFVERLLSHQPRIIGLSVYIWNATEMLAVVRMLKRLAPQVVVVVGGPEVSYETQEQEICALADYVVLQEGELAFAALCQSLLSTSSLKTLPAERIIDGGHPDPNTLPSPYAEYTDDDLKHRVVYVEASRGCAFKCEFCLSSLETSVRGFELEPFLAEMQRLLDRGLLQFKFVDRTFNLKIDVSQRILEFFLERLRPGLFLHFEMIPDRLPDELRSLLAAFPAGAVQLEVGVQSLDDDVSRRISRRQNVARLEDNLRYLTTQTGVHIHADLIVGLPGEDIATFARGFDRLAATGVEEIQVGILKRLRGTPIIRHDDEWGMVYAATPPYEILQTNAVSFVDMQRMKRFTRYWDLVSNSGRFHATLQLLWQHSSSRFASMLQLSDWLWQQTGAKDGIALTRLAELLSRFLVDKIGLSSADVHAAILQDFGAEKIPNSLRHPLPGRQARHARAIDAPS